MIFIPATASAAGQVRSAWNERILLNIEGGYCEADGFVSPSYNVYVVPQYQKVGKTWVPLENTLVRVLLDPNGQPCV